MRAAPGGAPAAGDGEGPGGPQRIAKVMARAGTCSRRDAERWIAEGRVALNGDVLTDPAINVRDDDAIMVDGEPLARRAPTRLFLFHKPRGLVATERDPEGRQTIFDHLRDHWPDGPRVVSIGRLDINTEGLLLLTNDGGLARVLELPSTGWLRRYRVRAKGETDQGVLDRLREGVEIDGVDYAGVEATLDRLQGANAWLTIGLREGKNREIKRVLDHIGLLVNRLIRVSFGPFQLGDLTEGAVEEVRTRVLRDQLGPLLAKAAGADFSSPPREDNDAFIAGAGRDRSPRGAAAAEPAMAPRGPRRDRPQGLDSRGERQGEGQRERFSDPRAAGVRSRRAPQAEKTAGAGIKGKPAPGPRKHVSALRAEEGAALAGSRKRIERAETADRSGRTVHVERLVPADPRGRKHVRGEAPAAPATRNGRRFEAERKSRDGDSRTAALDREPNGKAARFQRRSFERGEERSKESRAQGPDRENQTRDKNARPGRRSATGPSNAGPAPKSSERQRGGPASKFARQKTGKPGVAPRPRDGDKRAKPGGPARGKAPGGPKRSGAVKRPRTGPPREKR